MCNDSNNIYSNEKLDCNKCNQDVKKICETDIVRKKELQKTIEWSELALASMGY